MNEPQEPREPRERARRMVDAAYASDPEPDGYVALFQRHRTEIDAPEYRRAPVRWRCLGRLVFGNAETVSFPAAQSYWGVVVSCSLCDTSEPGAEDAYRSVPLNQAREVHCGDVITFPPGALKVAMDE